MAIKRYKVVIVFIMCLILFTIPVHAAGDAKAPVYGDAKAPQGKVATIKSIDNYIEATAVPQKRSGCFYFYDKLTKDQKKLYCAIYEAASNPTSKKDTCYYAKVDLNMDDYYNVKFAVLSDFPEIDWIDIGKRASFVKTKRDGVYITGVSIDGYDTIKEYNDMRNKAIKVADEILSKVDKTKSKACIAKQVYDLECKYMTYGYNNDAKKTYMDSAHSMYGALVNRKCVCDGYASLYRYLLRRLGIDCIVMLGQIDGENHAWNIVKMPDGKWYETDLSGAKMLDDYFSYFFLTTKEMKVQGHERNYPLASKDDNYRYYVHHFAPTANGTYYSNEYMQSGLSPDYVNCLEKNEWNSRDGNTYAAVLRVYTGTNYYAFDKTNANGKNRTVTVRSKSNVEFQKAIHSIKFYNSTGKVVSQKGNKAVVSGGCIKAIITMDNGRKLTVADKLTDSKSKVNCYKVKSVSLSQAKFKYNGKEHRPKVTVKGIDGKIIPASKYTVKFESNKKKGIHKVTVTFSDGTIKTKTVKTY